MNLILVVIVLLVMVLLSRLNMVSCELIWIKLMVGGIIFGVIVLCSMLNDFENIIMVSV